MTAIVQSVELADGSVEPLGWPVARVDSYVDISGDMFAHLYATAPSGREVPLLVECSRIEVTA